VSFFTGFVTGLAKSVDTQLKSSIERTRDNIDMISKFRLKKAEERQKEKMKKSRELEELIKDGAYAISGDATNIEAQNIAASLYKEQGRTGFLDNINFIKEQKKKDSGVNVMDYIGRVETTAAPGTYTLSEIVGSLADAESTYAPIDTTLPKDLIKGGGLIKAVVGDDFSITGAAEAQAQEQMQTLGLTPVTSVSPLNLSKFTLDREGMNYYTMGTNDKLAYLRDIIVDPESSDDQRAKAKDRENLLLQASIENGELATQEAALTNRLSYLKPTDAGFDAAVEQLQDIKDQIKLSEAATEGEASVLRVRSEIASRNGNREESIQLMRQAEDLVSSPTLQVLHDRHFQNMQIKLAGDDAQAYRDGTGKYEGKGLAYDKQVLGGYKVELASLEGGDKAISAINTLRTNIFTAAKQRLQIENPELLASLNITAADLADSSKLPDIIEAIESSSEENKGAFKEIIRQEIDAYKNLYSQYNLDTSLVDSAGNMLLGGTSGQKIATDDTGVDEAAMAGTDETAVSDKQRAEDIETAQAESEIRQQRAALGLVPLSDPAKASAEQAYPNTPEGVASFIAAGVEEGDSITDITNESKLIHDASFSTQVASTLDNYTNQSMRVLEELDAFSQNPIAAGVSFNLNPQAQREAVDNIMDILSVDKATAQYLTTQALNKKNAPISFKGVEINKPDVTAVLTQAGLLTSPLFGERTIPSGRFGRAVDRIAEAFGISRSEAETFLKENKTYPRAGEEKPVTIEDPELSLDERTDQMVSEVRELLERTETAQEETNEDAPTLSDAIASDQNLAPSILRSLMREENIVPETKLEKLAQKVGLGTATEDEREELLSAIEAIPEDDLTTSTRLYTIVKQSTPDADS
jgi:hypothetical protein